MYLAMMTGNFPVKSHINFKHSHVDVIKFFPPPYQKMSLVLLAISVLSNDYRNMIT